MRLHRDLRVGLPELNERLSQFETAKHSIMVVRRVVDGPSEAALTGGRADAQAQDKQDCEDSLFQN